MLTQRRLKEVLGYNPETGLFVWRVRLCTKVKIGSVAGCFDSKGYVIITIEDKPYKAHRLAWLYMEGAFPKHFIDHINSVPSDNRWINLREATWSESNANRKSTSKSGLKGVRQTPSDRWLAQIRLDGKNKHLGIFATKEKAHEAYISAAKKRHGEFFNGNCERRD